ncbi:hypothetical protein HDU93_007769 [Gonapodya sp. JEL0774]|nr:hypothetical protein HDU93_007769 [Gonapodya sp. JEL0774]
MAKAKSQKTVADVKSEQTHSEFPEDTSFLSFLKKYWWTVLISIASVLVVPNMAFAGPVGAVAMVPAAFVVPFIPSGVPNVFDKISPAEFATLLAASPWSASNPPREVPGTIIDDSLKLIVLDVREPEELERRGTLDAPNVVNVPSTAFRWNGPAAIRRAAESLDVAHVSPGDATRRRQQLSLLTDAESSVNVTVAVFDSHGNRAIKAAFALGWEGNYKRVVAVAGGTSVWAQGFRFSGGTDGLDTDE